MTEIGLTLGWSWVLGLGIGFVALGVVVGVVVGLLDRDWESFWFAALMGTIVGALFLGPLGVFALYAEPHNLNNFQIAGHVETVSNAGLAGGEDFTYRAYVLDLDSTDERLVTSDPRAVELVGRDVVLTCTPEFVFRGADRWQCVIAEVTP